jgi:uncharacterized membrane protein
MFNLLDLGLGGGTIAGALASAVALYGRYRILPAVLTGPHVCRLEAGGCQVLFRTPAASLLGVPNAVLGLIMYGMLGLGLLLHWPSVWLLAGSTLALAMSAYLARYLVANRLECRVCWTGHVANLVVWLLLLVRWLSERAGI